MEARRARRDHITKLFEITREDIRRGTEVGVDYFATRPSERTPLQEAKVTLADREIRSAIPIVIGPHPELNNRSRDEAERRFEDLIAELTGGNFQASDGEVDREQIRRLTHAGAGLRSALARMRDAELRMLASDDMAQNVWKRFLNWLDRKAGVDPPRP